MKPGEDRHWLSLPVPLSWLMDLDHCTEPGALAGAFGDSYLCRYNPVFAAVRNAAIAAGCRFSSEDTPLWRDYNSFSLITLHKIVTEGVIPYHETGSTLRRLLGKNPKAALSPGFIAANLRGNRVFHESAHCIAHALLQTMERDLRAVAPAEGERLVLEAVLAESFANTVERLGTACRHLPLSDTLFYTLNSYVAPTPKVVANLEAAGVELGSAMRFALLFAASFEANLTPESPGNVVYERIPGALGCDACTPGAARGVVDAAFGLNAGFRLNTTPMYFELTGLLPEYRALADSAWLATPENAAFFRGCAQRFATVAAVPPEIDKLKSA